MRHNVFKIRDNGGGVGSVSIDSACSFGLPLIQMYNHGMLRCE